MPQALRDRLASEIVQVGFGDLRPHARRGGLFVVHGAIDLVTVGVAVVGDDAKSVQTWISAGRLSRPTPAQLAAWEADETARFDSLIAQPFVLVRPI